MAQIEDGLVLRITSDVSKLTERIVLRKTPIFKDEEEKKEGEDESIEVAEVPKILQADEIQLYDFINKTNLKEDQLGDLQAVMILPSGEVLVQIVPVEVEPPSDFLVQARVSLINKLFFDAIMELQKDNRTVTNE